MRMGGGQREGGGRSHEPGDRSPGGFWGGKGGQGASVKGGEWRPKGGRVETRWGGRGCAAQ